MKAVTMILAGGAAMAALVGAAPASAQYYPGYGGTPYGYGSGYNGYTNGYNGYNNGYNGYGNVGLYSQVAVSQCTNTVQARLNANSGYGYNGYANQYGYNGFGVGRVLGISRVEAGSGGGLTIRGVANSGRSGAYGYNGGQPPVDLTFACRTDYRGYVMDIEVKPAPRNYGYNGYSNTSPYDDDYSQYGYRRY